MKTKEEFENVSRKLQELTAEELEQVTGGARATSCRDAVVPQIE